MVKLPSLMVCLFVLAACCSQSFSAAPGGAVGVWHFDGNLTDESGRANDAFTEKPEFEAGQRGQALRCGAASIVVADSPELRPAPGLRIDCWARIDSASTTYRPLLIKDHSYQLRIDPTQEGGYFSFFLNLGGWEPRVRAAKAAELGRWYHLTAGWDGKQIWLEVDGQRTSVARKGTPALSREPLELGKFDGLLDEVRIENPAAAPAGDACWLFEGDLSDSSGHGHTLTGPAEFVPGRVGQALKIGAKSVQAANHADLQLAPGFQLDVSVRFDKLPPEGRVIVLKQGEYQLRLNSAKEGGCFAFFTHLGGWEPRVSSDEPIVAGRWYRVVVKWSGSLLTLDVNGQRSHTLRSGIAKPTANPLVLGGPVCLDSLRIENPRLPTFVIRDAQQEHALLLVGRPEKFATKVCNVGLPVGDVKVRLRVPAGVRLVGPGTFDLGSMASGAEATVNWSVEADTPVLGAADIELVAAGGPAARERHPLVFFASEDGPPAIAIPAAAPGASRAETYYIDGLAGNNAAAGTSPETAWKDFTNINGKVLGPGQRLLLRRGSVFRQELVVSARGSESAWAEIGVYGEGARPIIRRGGDIDERCALIKNPSYLHIHGLVVCYAGKGLIVSYSEPGHRGLIVEDCIAHHIEGLYRFNAHGIPEWRDRRGATGDAVHNSPGIAVAGATHRDVLFRNCESFHCSSGYFITGDDVVIDRVYCHDSYCHNTSPHPFVVNVRRTVLKNSIFDASGWHASAGTMGIMLGDPQGLIIRNCVFRNQPDSGSHDEGGIDFENRGNGTLVDHCIFQNNAGAAIEVLGLKSPQTTNIEIRNSQFIENNTARKLGPGEIFIWGRARDASICCSNGWVRGNGYVLLPGVEFFVNEAPALTTWALENNTRYANRAEIDRAMHYNQPPRADAGPDVRTDQLRVTLGGKADDDNRPTARACPVEWQLLDGPGPVAFDNARSATTEARFQQPGDYTLRLVADDGELWTSDTVAVHILPSGAAVAKAWEFNRNLDKEGWSEVNPGTRVEQWPNKDWPTVSHPVKMVAGGHYTVAINESADAQLLSPDHIDVAAAGNGTVTVCLQNHTPASRMRLRFVTEADAMWDDAKSLEFVVQPNDDQARPYHLDFSKLPGWKGQLRQLRLDLASGKPLTGTCRIDYVWIGASQRP